MEMLSITFLGAVCLLYLIVNAVSRTYFSPLSKFPGPKLAAFSLWYEFYWDVVKRGSFIWRIEEMHQKYGIGVSARSNTCHSQLTIPNGILQDLVLGSIRTRFTSSIQNFTASYTHQLPRWTSINGGLI